MARDVSWNDPLGGQHGLRGDGDSEQCRLLVLCELELIVGTLETQTGERKSECIVGFFEDAGGFRERIGKGFAHTRKLGTLTGEKKGCEDQLQFYRARAVIVEL